MYLERLKGRKGAALEDMINDPMVVELKNGKIYGGRLDGYYYYHGDGGGVLVLYYCKLLDKMGHKWVDHDILTKYEDELTQKLMPDFWITDIKDIFVLPEEHRDKLSLEDTLQIYIDPHYKLPLTRVDCHWEPGENWEPSEEKHSDECDARLHEALSFLITLAGRGITTRPKDTYDQERRRLDDFFIYLRRRLLMYGAKIP